MLIFQLFFQISEICFQKAIAQCITFKTAAYIKGKTKSFCKHQRENLVPILAIFGTLSRKSSEIPQK